MLIIKINFEEEGSLFGSNVAAATSNSLCFVADEDEYGVYGNVHVSFRLPDSQAP